MILFYYCDEIFSNENERPENVEEREKTVMHLKGKVFIAVMLLFTMVLMRQ